MRIRSKAVTVLAVAGLLFGVGLVSAGNAGAASGWYEFGAGTGVHSVFYNGYTSDFSRAGSGIVEQWIGPNTAVGGVHGGYYLYKPVTTGTMLTPFKQSCDSQGQITTQGLPRIVTYTDPAITGADKYFVLGMNYWACQYDLSSWASGSVSYTLLGLDRHVTFDVQTAAPGFPAHGWMNYSDGVNPPYSIVVDAVYISGNTVTFSGPYPTGSTTQWLVLQAVNSGGTAVAWGGDVVSSDPSTTLSTYVPGLVGTAVTGTMTVYTR